MSGSEEEPERKVEIVFEGADDGPVDVPIARPADEPRPGPDTGSTSTRNPLDSGEEAPASGHVVGKDRLGNVVGAVNDTVEQLRQQRREAQLVGSGGPSRTTLFPERTAQVIQATQVDIAIVLQLISDGIVSGALELDAAVGVPRDGVAVFTGRLRMPTSRLNRRIELRIYPTASTNLTVLELLPRRRWMPQTERYLKAGVPVITDLTDRIEAEASPP
ncbi:MAG: hypothetical protein ACR2PK_02325 [Acidimicrobiales bacterium]